MYYAYLSCFTSENVDNKPNSNANARDKKKSSKRVLIITDTPSETKKP